MKRAAVIGLGDISGIHIRAIQENPNIMLAAVCDIDAERKAYAPESIPFYTDYEEMLRQEKPDSVHICLPHYLHVPVSRACIGMGAHVFCEKSAAINAKEAAEFAAFEKEHPKMHIGICLQNRFNESVEMLKKIIDSREYGNVTGTRGSVLWCRTREYYEEKPWRGKWKTAGGGCMINQSIHTLDLLYYLGGPVKGVKASSGQLLDYGIEVEDTVTARLIYESGASGLFTATNANYKNESVQIAVQLERAEFVIMDNILYRLMPDGGKVELAEDNKVPGTKFYYGASHGRLITLFYDALERESQNYLHVSDAVMSMRLIDAIQKSGRTGQFITL